MFLVFWFICLKASAMNLDHIEAIINDAIVNCLALAQIPVKEAAAIAGMTETHFRKALSGESYRHITLVHLLKLPYKFWLFFGPQIMWLVARKHAIEIAETISFLKEKA